MESLVTTHPRKPEPRRWAGLLSQAQRNAAERWGRALARGGFGSRAYGEWLAAEAAIAGLCAGAMDDVAGWHATQPALRDTAQAWAAELRELARVAVADARALGDVTPAATPVLGEWRVFLAGASGSQRAGEALGAVALHARLFAGNAAPALDTLHAAPFAQAARHYLARRRQQEADAVRNARDLLLDAYAGAALAAGAQRAAVWELDVINQAGIEHATQYS